MTKEIEWRKPFYVAVPNNGRSTIEVPFGNFRNCSGMIAVTERDFNDPKHSFKLYNSDLLVAIDKDNVRALANAFHSTNLDVNQKYVIPHWEVPEACPWPGQYVESFLNRAAEAGSQKAFTWLLAHGADPRAKNYLGKSVLDQIIDHPKLSRVEKFKMGEALVDAGLTTDEVYKAQDPGTHLKVKVVIHNERAWMADMLHNYAAALEESMPAKITHHRDKAVKNADEQHVKE